MRNDYDKTAQQLKHLIFQTIDRDRNRAIELYGHIKRQLDQHPQAMLLIGDKAVQTLDNLQKQVINMIRMYQIQKRKVTKSDKTPQAIQDLLREIQKQNENKSN